MLRAEGPTAAPTIALNSFGSLNSLAIGFGGSFPSGELRIALCLGQQNPRAKNATEINYIQRSAMIQTEVLRHHGTACPTFGLPGGSELHEVLA
eukprot:scaffold647359_cov47-Prasinocladus_malaysianus.AAC.1